MTELTGWIARRDGKAIHCELENITTAELDGLDIEIDVHYSGINYKDALALHGRPGVVRRFPLIVGIDVTGEVVSSDHGRFRRGDLVMLHGAGLGEELHGGLATRARLSSEQLLSIPETLTPKQAAAVGTAGLTAALCIRALESHGLRSGFGPVLVTGASGGVGSLAVSLLAGSGYEVVAATGRPEEQGERLRQAGAAEVIHRDELVADRPLQTQRWEGVIDSVGGRHLAGAIASTREGGAVAACGLAGSADLPSTVLPFILRGVSLLGVDSVHIDRAEREAAWDLIARDLDQRYLDRITRVVPLAGAKQAAAELLEGRGTGRTVVDAS